MTRLASDLSRKKEEGRVVNTSQAEDEGMEGVGAPSSRRLEWRKEIRRMHAVYRIRSV